MKKLITGLILGLCCWAVAAASHAEHYALCTGLNKYKTSYVPSSNFLNGCVPDAKNVYTNITLRGEWDAANATLFTNSEGTFAAVSNKLMSFASAAVSGDVVLYYHSSHGYQDSGKNTGICMYDQDMPDSSFAKILANFKAGVKVIIVLDTCHSGGMFKGIRRDGSTRDLDTGAPFAFAQRVNEELAAIRADEAARGIRTAAKLAILDCAWVTAADYNQYSWDGDEGGAFTECYIGSVKSGACDKTPYGNGDSYATFMEMFNYAVAQDDTHGDGKPGSEDYTMPQCTNTTILSAVTFGWVGKEEPSGVRFDPIPEQTATVGQKMTYTLTASNRDGSDGKITFSVASSTAPAGSYSLVSDSGAFSFTPSKDGSFSFNFVATNTTAKTGGKTTMTVTADLPAPTGLSNSGITANSFTANWDKTPGALSYLLDVASEPFGSKAARDDAILSENFDALADATLNQDVSSKLDDFLTGTGWTGSKVFGEGDAAKLGSSKANGWIATPALDLSAGGTVSFSLTKYSANGDGNTVLVSTVSGGKESEIGSATPGDGETVEFAIPAADAATKVKIATSAKRAIIDNLVITAGGGADVLANQEVSGTSFTVEGLETSTYYWRVRAVGNAKGPYSETEEVTLKSDPSAPPSIRPIADIDITVGETATAAVKVSAPDEAPVTTLSITTGDTSATLVDGEFSFAPAAPGSYDFTITAVNANGSVSVSFTVTAVLAKPEAPTASKVGSASFTAAWTAVPGATAYELLVIEGKGGPGGGGAGDVLTETFAKATFSTTSSSYVDQTITGGDLGTWTATSCRGDQAAPVVMGQGTLTSPEIAGGVASVEVDYSWPYSESGTSAVDLYVGGLKVASADVTGGTEGTATYSFAAVSGATSIKFDNTASSKKRMSFDQIRITTAGKSIARAKGDVAFSNDVGNVTSYDVTGLQPLTEYTFAIRAFAGEEATEWSDAASVTTTEGPAAPAWSAIPAQAAAVGFEYRIDLSAYVSGSPTPTLILVSGEAEFSGTVLSFTPAAEGSYSFTVSAANGVGEPASVTFEVAASEHQPTKYAVCVGINKYKEISGLSGCVNDSQYMANSLIERGGWNSADVTLLNDSKATKSAIRGAIAAVAAKAAAGDTFVYQHSSHGGQFNDTTGDIISGEEGKATFLCVYDEEYDDNKTAYNDYELAADLAAFPAGVKVVVIVDACHSGGLFKSKEEARAAAASFDLAGRVTAIMDADRAQRKARGENVAKTLASSEIGWATACEYYETSYDGGFFHTDEWLTNNVYGDEYWNENTEEYNYPSSYKQGGVFTTSAMWGWWNGTGDSDPEAGDNDGFCDTYEFWKKGYDFCSVVGEFWWEEPEYNYYPQCTNIAVLKSVELGWIVDTRLPAPENPAAPMAEVAATSFTATWDPVDNAESYNLYVQQKVENAKAAESTVVLEESFEDGEIPAGWVASDKGVGIASGKSGDGDYCVKFTASGAWLVTPAVENPETLSLIFMRSKNQADWSLDIAVGKSADGPWETFDRINGASTSWQDYSADIKDTGTCYFKFTDTRSDGAAERYIDLVTVTGSAGTWVDVPGYAPANVVGTSKLVEGLEMGTEYRFSVTAVDAGDTESAPSEFVTVTTAEEDHAPVWSEIPEQSAVIGQEFSLDLSAYVSASPVATITVAGSPVTGGVFTFMPDAEGEQSFALVAENDLGKAEATLTVVVTAAPITVPVLTLSNAQSTSFDAAWTACTGATSYQLQVATDDQFPGGGATGGSFTLVTSAADLTAGEYVILGADADNAMNNTCSGTSSGNLGCKEVTVSGSTLSTEDASIIWTLAGDASSCTLFNSAAGKFVNPATTRACGWSDTASGSWTLSLSDGVVSVANAASSKWKLQYNSGSPRFAMYESTQKNLRFFRRSGKAIAKDGSSMVLDTTTSELSYTVADLTPETTYYARVRMADGDWSDVENIATLEAGPAAPVWSAIPAQSTYAGATFQLDLSSFLTGNPEPTVTADVGTVTGLHYVFEPDATGTVTVTLTAANDSGSAQTSFVLMVAEAPVGGTHYAVVVGCNKYDTKYIDSDNFLNGCVPDATHVHDLITSRGAWDAANVTKLTDSAANHSAIHSAISKAAANAVAGDTFLYFHSSHGGNYTYTFVTNTALYKDYPIIVYGVDPDGVDNCVCAYDADYTAAELASDLAAFDPGVNIVVMIDACHSAGMFKYDSSPISSRVIRRNAAGAAMHSGVPALFADAVTAQLGAIRRARGIRAASNVAFVTAADFDEYSWDSQDGDGGEFTTAFIEGVTNGVCDGADYGDQDGWATFYEGWNYAKDIATGCAVGTEVDDGVYVDENGYALYDNTYYAEEYDEPKYYYDYYFTHAQITNEALLRVVRVGYAGTPTLAAPVAAPAANVTESSFTASWSSVDGASAYRLQVATDSSFSTGAASDTLSASDFAATGTTYTEFAGVTKSSGAVYAGKTAKNNSGAIQLNATTSTGAGIWTTKSGGNVSRVAVEWNSATSSGRSLQIYGSATALTSYSDVKGATLVGSISYGSGSSLDITDAYAYVGIIANGGALYLDSVTIDWGTAGSGSTIVLDQDVGNVTSFEVTGLEAETDYYYRVQALGDPVDSDFSNVISLTTEGGTPAAPVWSAIPQQTVVAGEDLVVDLNAYVSGSPKPAITADAGTVEAGVLTVSFAEAGEFTVALTAENTEGKVSTTMAVAVSAAPVTVPVLALSNPQATSFDASWTACTGVSSYTLQVATDDQFTTGSASGAVELFSNPASSATAPEGWTYDISSKTSKYVVLDDTEQSVVSPAVSTKGMASLTIAFKSRTYGGAGAGVALVEYSADGSTWAELGTAEAENTTMANRTIDAAKCIGLDSVKFRWTAPNATGSKGVGIQDLVLSGEGSGGDGSLVKELTVENTSTTVDGLEPETLYYARVKGTAEWSAVESIKTQADVPAAPEWLDIPTQTAIIGQEFGLDLSIYVTGSPFPTITVDGTVAEGGSWSFTPDVEGPVTFELVATNTEGSDSTTLTVMVSEAPAAKYALCVGLNEYDYTAWEEQGWSISPLKGCVNDATYLKKNLTERGGWEDADVTLLTDAAATKDALRGAIAAAAAKAKAGDTFVYQHSSHGLNNDNPYGKDVALATYASPYEDFELAEDLEAFADGVKVVIVIDACHSAGMFKKGAATPAESFDIAARVSALMDANRNARKARGEDVSRNLSSDQVGWVTAADYDEESKDGGYYDTDEWLSDDDAEGKERGGTFLSSFTWGWWSGKADVSGTGDGDGWFDAYEGWSYASPVCLDEGFTPQFLNESVLRSVELGYAGETAPSAAIVFDPVPGVSVAIGEEATLTVVAKNADGTTDGITLSIVATDPEGLEYTFADGTLTFTPEEDGLFLFTVQAVNGRTSVTKLLGVTAVLPAPVALAATDIAEDGFTANWTGVEGAQGYQLQVSTDPKFPEPEPDKLIEEGFDDVTTSKDSLPEGWTFNGSFGTYATGGEAPPSIKLSTDKATLITPTFKLTASESGLSFWTKGNGTDVTSTLTVEQFVGDKWLELAAPFVPSKDGETKEIEGLDPAATQIQFVMAKLSGNIAIDDVMVAQMSGPVVLDDDEIPAGTTSYAVEDLDPGTTYYYRVRALANTKSAWSEVIEVTTSGEAPVPVPDLTVGLPETNPDTAIYAIWLCDGVSLVHLQVAKDAEFGAESLVFDEEVSDDVCVVSGLTPETTYYVRVCALGGEWSNVESITTAAAGEPEGPVIGGEEMADFELISVGAPDPVTGETVKSIKAKAIGNLATEYTSVKMEYAVQQLENGNWDFESNDPVPNKADWPEIEFDYPAGNFAIMRFVFE